jgi:hypothetical protein
MTPKLSAKIIALSGKRGAGKTAAAQHLRDKHGFKIVSFAAKLKDTAKLLHPNIDRWHKERPRPELGGHTPREYYITLGSHERFYNPDYWVTAALEDRDLKENIVIDDLRFENEAKYLKELGAKLIRIERYEYLNIYGKNLDDPSETALDNYAFDYKIEACRNVSLADLTTQIDYALGVI